MNSSLHITDRLTHKSKDRAVCPVCGETFCNMVQPTAVYCGPICEVMSDHSTIKMRGWLDQIWRAMGTRGKIIFACRRTKDNGVEKWSNVDPPPNAYKQFPTEAMWEAAGYKLVTVTAPLLLNLLNRRLNGTCVRCNSFCHLPEQVTVFDDLRVLKPGHLEFESGLFCSYYCACLGMAPTKLLKSLEKDKMAWLCCRVGSKEERGNKSMEVMGLNRTSIDRHEWEHYEYYRVEIKEELRMRETGMAKHNRVLGAVREAVGEVPQAPNRTRRLTFKNSGEQPAIYPRIIEV